MKKFERPKASKREDGVDFISNMPDHILLLILSGLRSTEQVIRTSILSKRWRYLWTSVPFIDISYSRRRTNFKENEFIEFVSWVLRNKSVDLDSFRLDCSSYYRMSTVQQWIYAAVSRNTKELDLTLWPNKESENIEMPHFLVTCGSLEVLRLFLHSSRLILPTFPGFSALRVLELEQADLLEGDVVKYFLESCPFLEDLTLVDCLKDEVDLLCISCPKLKKLKLSDIDDDDGTCGCLKICCPNLVFLKLRGPVASEYFIEHMDLLKEAVIIEPTYEIHESSMLIPGISHVESLQIDFSFICRCIDVTRDPALPNLKTLQLTGASVVFIDDFTSCDCIKILKCCPKLESLSLSVENTFSFGFLGPEDLELVEAKTGRILTPDVKWVESFEFNGEKPKLDIIWDGNEWDHMVAKWGKETSTFKGRI